MDYQNFPQDRWEFQEILLLENDIKQMKWSISHLFRSQHESEIILVYIELKNPARKQFFLTDKLCEKKVSPEMVQSSYTHQNFLVHQIHHTVYMFVLY